MVSLWSLLSRVLIEQFDVMCYPVSVRLSALISPLILIPSFTNVFRLLKPFTFKDIPNRLLGRNEEFLIPFKTNLPGSVQDDSCLVLF